MKEKTKRLREYLLDRGRVAVAFSGGLDSSILLAYAVSVLGKENCLALTACTPYMMMGEMAEASSLATELGVEHIMLNLPVPDEVRNNPLKRCYLCKKNLFTELRRIAWEKGFFYIVDGTNKDDQSDYRPGMAALQELKIESPLMQVGIGKDDIRALGRQLGLKDNLIEKAAYACLLTRWEHEVPFEIEDLRKIDKAEDFLKSKGFKGIRVRVHDNIARLELMEEDWGKLMDINLRKEIVDKLQEIGYSFISIDLAGYRKGSMNKQSDNGNA